ncbi:acetyl-CoA carboxylase, carboxyltransferase subunit beta [Saccharopolyspora sp. 5N708]|uniref:acetyl-CoA carboxylase, carboxyltransferase subunit beta n=1 Tax=Saccharopolyspora sp. 5N708 TaxID=3457424 RepID=UPI003FD5E640
MTEKSWRHCPGCGAVVYGKRLARQLGVCPECGRHDRVPAAKRLEQLLDPGSSRLIDCVTDGGDPLRFQDTSAYPDRLAAARAATGLTDAVLCAHGTVHGHSLVVAAMDFRFLGGSLGTAVGEAITRAAEAALADRIPLLLVCASGGARMQEGVLSLMQMGKTSSALAQLDEAGVLTISLITDPTYGGVAASFATLADVLIAEPGARLGFAGPRVIRQTIGAQLPSDFQTAEFLLAHGIIDMIRPRAELRATLARLLAAAAGQATEEATSRVSPAVTDPELLPAPDPWELVRCAREPSRPTTSDYIELLLDGFDELHGDRLGDDCPSIVGGIGSLAGRPVVVIGHQKGHTPTELAARNFGMPSPSGYRKAARLARLAAKIGIPVLTLIDTPGAHPGITAEERGQAVAIAESIRLFSALPVPVVAVVIGEGGSGGALALGVADRVYSFAGAYYSVISPEGCAAILWDDRCAAPHAAAALGLTARDLLSRGVVDGVLPEPAGGTGNDHEAAAAVVRDAVVAALDELAPLPPAELVARRRTRWRAYGSDRVLSTVEG